MGRSGESPAGAVNYAPEGPFPEEQLMRGRTIALTVSGIGVLLVAGWTVNWLRVPPRLPAVPEELMLRAGIPGIPGARYWVATDIQPFVKDTLASRERERKYLAS